MKTNHPAIVTSLCLLVLCMVTTSPALALYHAGMGRYMQRDPHGTMLKPASLPARDQSRAFAATQGFMPRDRPDPAQNYPDGINTYAAHHTMTWGTDQSGMVSTLKNPQTPAIIAELERQGIGAGIGGTAIVASQATGGGMRVQNQNRLLGKTCTDKHLKKMNRLVHTFCDLPRSCKCAMSCAALRRAYGRNSACENFRRIRDVDCWRGGDNNHLEEQEKARRAKNKCWGYALEKGCKWAKGI